MQMLSHRTSFVQAPDTGPVLLVFSKQLIWRLTSSQLTVSTHGRGWHQQQHSLGCSPLPSLPSKWMLDVLHTLCWQDPWHCVLHSLRSPSVPFHFLLAVSILHCDASEFMVASYFSKGLLRGPYPTSVALAQNPTE